MKTFSITDTGRVRTSNQDYVFCEENAIGSFPNLFLVADGMGGHKAGDTASRMCVEEIVSRIQKAERKTPVGIMEQAIESANRMIYEKSTEAEELAGMGTTIVGTTIQNNTAYIVNVGDSRLYQMRDVLQQITVDHSLVEEMVQSGEIQKDEMRTHPNKNIITRALGTDMAVRPDCFEIEVREGDVLLLCSDGLSNMLDDVEIEKIVRENIEDMKKAGESLVRQANEAGGKDNISVILIRL
ncbi:MAG: Stp1/IreP family PP2C-type Ser/Thr phosphatase [Lachnospiraceae bacterium]|nr:Stp1/IreP family PP2C-type Ser/Thr phosphatase [Lachnospiraceae bacterium]